MEQQDCQATNTNHFEQDPFYGDIPGPKREGHIRIHSVNVNRMPATAVDSKNQELFTAMRKYQTDVLLGQEIGVNWSAIPRQDQWRKRMEDNLDGSDLRTYCGHNQRDEILEKLQWGGTMVASVGWVAHHAMGAGTDSTKLGRWTWARYRGREGITLRCVSVYAPCKNETGEKNVYRQHKKFLQNNNDDRDPVDAFWEDLRADIRQWQAMGDQIIIGGDINDEVSGPRMTNLCRVTSMRDVTFEKHEREGAPPSYSRNNGKRIVDGIWATTGIKIRRCGYLEAGEFPGDHCCFWADVTIDSALGINPPTPTTAAARRLKLKEPKVVERYLGKYQELAQDKDLFRRQHALENKLIPGRPLSRRLAKEANKIDQDRTICMKKAEKKCRKLRMGCVAFSDATEKPRKEISFWRLAIKRRRGGRVSPKLWSRKKKEAKIKLPTRTMTVQDMQAQLRTAMREYAEAKKIDMDSRIKFIETFPPKISKRILRREEQVRLGKVAKMVSGKDGNKSVTSVELNDGTTLHDKRPIETAVKTVNEAKIRASETTPFLMEPLVSAFGLNGHSPAVDEVLNGTYNPPPEVDLYTRKLLQAMKKPQVEQPAPDISTFITTEDHMKAWKKAKERTSAGRSGLHFGMFKAQASHKHLAALDASMRNVAYSTGFVYQRWKQSIDVQILKRSRDYRLEKLRTIKLLEADFNINNKKLGKDVSWKGERECTLERDNYGGRKKLRSSEISLNEQLTFDSVWGKRGRAVLISNDAMGCFDRIAHMVAYICMLRLGAPAQPVQSMINAIQEMTHYIRTAFGDSDSGYGNDASKLPAQGLLQGSGSAPTGWSSVSTALVAVMKDEGLTYKSWTYISQRVIEIACFAFVDDTDLVVTPDHPNQSNWELIQKAQKALNTWEGILKASGGALHPDKSYWYLIEVIRNNGQWTYSTRRQSPGNLYLNNEVNPITAKRLEVNQAKEALGIQRRPDGSMEDEVEYLRSKTEAWKERIKSKKLKRGEAWYCLNSTIMKTIEYPLAATTMSREEIDYIMAPALGGALPKCGFQRNFPRKLVYGTLRSQGVTLPDPFITQLIEHIHVIQRHGHRPTPTQMNLQDNMELVQVYVGSERPFWDLPYEEYGFLAPEGWMQWTWEQLAETSLQLKGPLATLKRLREHDQFIMDAFILRGFNNETLLVLNNCRLYLRVTTLAEMSSADGKHIDIHYWRGIRQSRQLHEERKYPGAYKPSANEWTIWKDALRETFMAPFESHRKLDRTLGPWCEDSKAEWIWWYSPLQHQVFERQEDGAWLRWPLRQHRAQRPRFGPNPYPALAQEIPNDISRCSVAVNRTRTTVMMTSSGTTLPTPQPHMNTIYDKFKSMPTSAHWALQHTLITDNAQTIATAIANGTLVAVSDGSWKMFLGTAAFVMEGVDSTNRIFGVNKVPGPLKDGDSYRCELAGLYSIVLIGYIICKHFDLHPIHSATIACDNESALRVFACDFIPDPNEESFDLLQGIWQLLRMSPLRWIPEHVHGHQDKHPTVGLSRLALLNIEMDSEAKAYWRNLVFNSDTFPEPECHEIYQEGWSVWLGDQKIASPSKHNLYAAIQDPVTIEKWVRLGRFPEAAIDLIDWDCCEVTMKSQPLHIRRWVTKHAADECGIGVTLEKWNMQDDDACPRCGASETSAHVIQCTGAGANTVWYDNIRLLTEKMTELDTHPAIQEVLIHHVNRWRQQVPANVHMPAEHAQAIAEQNQIGWKNLLEGLPSKRWVQLQQRHYNDINTKRTGRTWMKETLKLLSKMAHDQWLHRNAVKHKTLRPRQLLMEQRLNTSLTTELLKGQQNLPQGDAIRFDTCLATLLTRSLPYRKSWLTNVCAARQRQTRRRLNNNDLQTTSKENSTLLQWIKTGRAV